MNGGLKGLNNVIKAGVAMFALKITAEEGRDWDAKSLFAAKEEHYALTATSSSQIDFERDWVVDSGCANHITGDVKKLQNLSDYKGSIVVCTADNSAYPITHVGSAVVSSKSNNEKLPLQQVHHVEAIKGNLISVSQLTSSGHFVLFGPQDVKLYRKVEISEEPIMKGRMLKSLYVISGE